VKKHISLLEKVKETIEKYRMFSPDTKVVVGVSGGPDSSTLLHLLCHLKSEYDLDLWAAHLNHGLRGKEAAEDAEWVKRFTFKLGVPLIPDSLDVASLAKEKGLGLEEAGRRARYDFFEDVAHQVAASKIALGHTASDQIETILMRLIKGAGLDGLCGIPPLRGKVVRPLIEVFREEIEKYCEENNLEPCLDSSNKEISFLRNRIRLELLPFLKEYNPQIGKALFQMGKILKEDVDFLKEEEKKSFKALLKEEGEKAHQRWLVLDREKLSCLHPALQKRVLREAVRETKGNLKGITFNHLVSILKLNGEKGAKQLNLPGDLVVQREYKDLLIRKGKPRDISFASPLIIPGKTKLPQLNLVFETELISQPLLSFSSLTRRGKIKLGEKREFPEKEAWLDFDKLELPLFLRKKEKGDRFTPLGMEGSKKVKDFFIDLKVPSQKRERVPLLISKGKVVWVVGYRISECFKVDKETKKILKIRISKTND